MFLIRSVILAPNSLAGIRTPRPQNLFRAARHQIDLGPCLRFKHLRATTLPVPPPLSALATSKDFSAARDWLKSFGGCSIPKEAVDMTFARSSGPGGQVCRSSTYLAASGTRR